MAPKKPNAFMSFMFEYKEKNGRTMSIIEATAEAGELWKNMTPKEREPYQKLSKVTGPLQSKKEKLTCLGTPIELVMREQKEKEKSEEQMIKTINRTVKLALDGNRLENEKFYFIMVNYFVRLMQNGVYVPAEIAAVEFSLNGGVSRKYHTLVNPNIDMFGNLYEAQHFADTTHKLPLPPKALGESDMSKISTEILSFIMDKDFGIYPPLYTHDRAMGYVSSVLSFLSEDCGETVDNDLSKVNVYSMQELLYSLKCAVCKLNETEKPRNRFVCDTILDKDVYEYARNIACDYHEEIDRSNYCALSHVYRWGFSFVDYMANDLPIDLIPGRHMPDTINVSEITKASSISCAPSHYESELCGAVSAVSLESKYQSFNITDIGTDNDLTGISSSRFLSDTQGSIATAAASSQIRQDYNFKMDSIYSANDMSFNPFHRENISKPPDSQFLSIEYEEENDKTRSSVTSRRLGRGRGILLLDELK